MYVLRIYSTNTDGMLSSTQPDGDGDTYVCIHIPSGYGTCSLLCHSCMDYEIQYAGPKTGMICGGERMNERYKVL